MSTLTHRKERTTAPTQTQAWSIPRAHIREEAEGYLLLLEMPGVAKEGVEITVENQELTIVGHRSDANLKGEPLHRESRPHDYRRVFDLDPAIDTGRITAKIEHGVATLRLPKAEKVKPRKIVVSD